ncbi:MAG: peroxiredoxin [Pseudobdellovibrionaceae bacterium]
MTCLTGILAFSFLFLTSTSWAEIKPGDPSPLFSTKTHEGKDFDLQSRKGSWTVLYFYPKAGTPGCTKQACAFRDNIEKIRSQGAEVFGISSDGVKEQAAFHQEHKLNFTLLADPEAEIVKKFGTKMPAVNLSKRWTFIIGPDLKIRDIQKDVDPLMDAERVAKRIKELKTQVTSPQI